MIGFDDKAKEYILSRIKEDNAEMNIKLANKVIDLAFEGELAYFKKHGMLENGELVAGEYDEDTAFDIMIDKITRALPDKDVDELVDILEVYIEYHDAFMEEEGLLEWE